MAVNLNELDVLQTTMTMNLQNDPSIKQLIELARHEDLGHGDLSSRLLAHPDSSSTFKLLARQPCVLAGCEIASMVLHAYHEDIKIKWYDTMVDGFVIDQHPAELATITGPLSAVLSAERVLLNFLQRLCGIATITHTFVQAISSTRAKIFDTRKTTPGWRSLEKYAVRCGGGHNHRQGLFDAVMLKDNHLTDVVDGHIAPAIFEMLNRLADSKTKPEFVEVEADTLEQVSQLFKIVGIDIILLDNFSHDDLCQAVAMREELGLADKIELEASGGITLKNVQSVAQTGVDRISIGALTHSATAIDLSLERCG